MSLKLRKTKPATSIPVRPRTLVDEVRALHDRGKQEHAALIGREETLKTTLATVQQDKAQTDSITTGLAQLLKA